MGKKGKRLFGTVGILVLVIVVYVVVTRIVGAGNDTAEEDSGIAVSQIGAENITAFSYSCEDTNGEFLTMFKVNDIWYYEDDENFPLNQSFVTVMAKSAAEVNASRKLEGDLQELSAYGLENPAVTVHVNQKNGEVETFFIGDYNESTECYYLKIDGSPDIYLVDGTLKLNFSMALYDLVEMENYPLVETGSFVHVKIEKADLKMEIKGITKEDAAEYIGEDYYMEQEKTWLVSFNDSEYSEGNQIKLKALIEELSAYEFYRKVNYKADKSELATYGLDDPEIKITVDYQILDETTARVVEHGNGINEIVCDTLDKQYILLVGDPSADMEYGEDYYVKLQDSDAIYTMEASLLNRVYNLKASDYKK